MPTTKRVTVVINPASGQDEPVLAQLNRGFGDKIAWNVIVTQEGLDDEVARQVLASDPDIVTVYGGDGTIARLVTRVDGLRAPIAVLPGGTANALAQYLGATEPVEMLAARIASGQYTTRTFDKGVLGSRTFLLRVSIGLAAGFTHHADRSAKDRFGALAYAMSALRAVRETNPTTYRLELDGHVVEHQAVACIVANSGGTGLGLPLVGQFDAHDGLLDVVLIPEGGRGLTQVLANVAKAQELVEGFPRWNAVEVGVSTSEPQPVHVDGENAGTTPVRMRARAASVCLVVFPGAPEVALGDASQSEAPRHNGAS